MIPTHLPIGPFAWSTVVPLAEGLGGRRIRWLAAVALALLASGSLLCAAVYARTGQHAIPALPMCSAGLSKQAGA